MTKQSWVEIEFRERVRREREHRGWSQIELASRLRDARLTHMIGSMVAKVESGDRSVRIDEANAIADAFGLSVDILLGRGRSGTELALAVSKLTGNAQKVAADVVRLRERVTGDMEDVRSVGYLDGEVLDLAQTVVLMMAGVETALARLAGQFPLPT